MAQLYFYYSAMNAGKSTMLLQTRYNYAERGMKTLLFVPSIGKRANQNEISSRIGLRAPASAFERDFDFFAYIEKWLQTKQQPLAALLIDEAQFLTKKQVEELTDIVDQADIPVLTYGLRTDFLGNLFEGSYHLLAWAENIKEIKNVCHCGKKAIMSMRVNQFGKKMMRGEQVQIGGNEAYVATCRHHFKTGDTVPFVASTA